MQWPEFDQARRNWYIDKGFQDAGRFSVASHHRIYRQDLRLRHSAGLRLRWRISSFPVFLLVEPTDDEPPTAFSR